MRISMLILGTLILLSTVFQSQNACATSCARAIQGDDLYENVIESHRILLVELISENSQSQQLRIIRSFDGKPFPAEMTLAKPGGRLSSICAGELNFETPQMVIIPWALERNGKLENAVIGTGGLSQIPFKEDAGTGYLRIHSFFAKGFPDIKTKEEISVVRADQFFSYFLRPSIEVMDELECKVTVFRTAPALVKAKNVFETTEVKEVTERISGASSASYKDGMAKVYLKVNVPSEWKSLGTKTLEFTIEHTEHSKEFNDIILRVTPSTALVVQHFRTPDGKSMDDTSFKNLGQEKYLGLEFAELPFTTNAPHAFLSYTTLPEGIRTSLAGVNVVPFRDIARPKEMNSEEADTVYNTAISCGYSSHKEFKK